MIHWSFVNHGYGTRRENLEIRSNFVNRGFGTTRAQIHLLEESERRIENCALCVTSHDFYAWMFLLCFHYASIREVALSVFLFDLHWKFGEALFEANDGLHRRHRAWHAAHASFQGWQKKSQARFCRPQITVPGAWGTCTVVPSVCYGSGEVVGGYSSNVVVPFSIVQQRRR